MNITFFCKLTPLLASGDSAAINSDNSDETTPSSEWPLEKIDDTTLGVYNVYTLPVPYICTSSLIPSVSSLCTDIIRVLHDVSIAVVTVVHKRELGLALGLSRHTLKRIAADYPGDSCRYLTEILAAWLQKEDESTPSWRALAGALRKPTVREEGLADVIAKAHGMLTTRVVMVDVE